MKNLNVIRFMKVLTPEEFKLFDKYVHSPLYNNPESGTTRLFDAIKPYYPDFPEEHIDKEKVFKTLFPDESFFEKRIYDLGLQLYRLLQNFLALHEHSKDQELWEPVMLIQALLGRGLDAYLPTFLEDAQEKMLAYPLRDEDFYLYQQKLSQAQSNLVLSQNTRSRDIGMSRVIQELNQRFLIIRLSLAVSMINRSHIIQEENTEAEMEEVLDLYKRIKSPDNHVADLYYAVLNMLLYTEEDRFYQNYRKLISQHGHLISDKARYDLSLYGVNYCARQIKQGKSEYWEEVYSIYVEMLEENIFFISPANSHLNFKNLNNVSISLNKLDWTKSFIKKYGNKLALPYRETVVNYCMARIYFEEKDYVASIKQLNNVTFIDPVYRLNYDFLLIKIYYESKDFQALFSRCEATLKYIKRDKSLSDKNKLAYSNMVRFSKRIANFTLKQKKNLDWIRRDFEASQELVDRKWLAEKIAELAQ